MIQLKARQPAHAWQALNSAASLTPGLGKIFIVVDEDIDPHDLDAVMWAMVFRVQPHRDIQTVTGRRPMMDPSAVSPAQPGWHHHYPSRTALPRCSSTRSQVALPARSTAGQRIHGARAIMEGTRIAAVKTEIAVAWVRARPLAGGTTQCGGGGSRRAEPEEAIKKESMKLTSGPKHATRLFIIVAF